MKKLKVDRFDGTMVIFTDKEKKFFAIEKAEIPFDLKKGDLVEIDEEGKIVLVKK